jgi:hypothetical protein
MTTMSSWLAWCLKLAFCLGCWQAIERTVSAQTLLFAQTGTTKTLIGWLIVLLCIGLGILVVCRPSARRANGKR